MKRLIITPTFLDLHEDIIMPENIDWEFIASLEGKGVTTGYVPDAAGSKSGVTIATGFDLGQRNESDLTTLGLTSDLITKLKPYLGKKGTDAADYLKDNPLTITDAQAAEIDKLVKAQKVPKLKTAYKTAADNTKNVEFDDLPGQAQTVIASVSFQYGTLSTKTPKFWKAVVTQDWPEAVKILRAFGDSYPTRRGKEADRLEQVVKFNEMIAKLLSYIPFWVVIFMLFGVSCSSVHPQVTSEIYDPVLQKAFSNYDAAAAEKRSEIKFESGSTAQNCTEYWNLKKNSKPVEDVATSLYLSEYQVCDAIRLLKNASDQRDTGSVKDIPAEYTKRIFERLDLSSFPSSISQMTDETSNTFKTIAGKLQPEIKNNRIVSDTDDRNYVLDIAAKTDADGNGKPDLIVWVTDESKEGNYRSYSTIVVLNVDGSGSLNAVPAASIK